MRLAFVLLGIAKEKITLCVHSGKVLLSWGHGEPENGDSANENA